MLNHLKEYGSITSWEAIERYGITRLGAHIEVLRNDENYTITGENCHNERTHWKLYKLEEPKEIPLREIKTGTQSQYSFV